MKVNYMAVSKDVTNRFKKNRYIIKLENRTDTKHEMVYVYTLEYGYIENGFRRGANRGWYYDRYSMLVTDFDKYASQFDIISGIKNIKKVKELTFNKI